MGPSTTTSSPPPTGSPPLSYGTYEQTRKAIDAIQNKAPVADIDFSIHVMEDGTEVSTQERVCKGNFVLLPDDLLTLRN
jgi:hypothetical protein